MTFGEKISNLRKANGMTQEELGRVMNITYQAVSKWERGESLPDFNTMSQLAKLFKVPLSYFEEDGEISLDRVAQENHKQPQALAESLPNYVGTCAVCGKLLKEGENYPNSQKVICKSCAAKIIEKRNREKAELARKQAYEREKLKHEQLGTGFDLTLGISLVIAVACYVLFTVLVFTFDFKETSIYGFLMPFITIAVFAIVHSIADFITDKDIAETDGYTRNLSLIVGGVFAAVNIVLYLIFFFTFGNNIFYVIMLFAGAVISFTFVSQFMWGSVVKDIFLCGGFTFKLPGFIFSLTVDSILWMIVTKIFLGIIAALVFIVTTVFVSFVAMAGSVVTFIPCLISKTVKDRNA